MTDDKSEERELELKVCARCGLSFPKADYPPRSGRCRACDKIRRQEWRVANAEKHRAAQLRYRERDPIAFLQQRKAYRATIADKELQRHREWDKANPEKRRARKLIERELHEGRMVRPDHCQGCGKQCKPSGHHFDYEKPLSVVWVCGSCHYLLDRQRAKQRGEK